MDIEVPQLETTPLNTTPYHTHDDVNSPRIPLQNIFTDQGTSGYVLKSNGSGSDPTFQAVQGSNFGGDGSDGALSVTSGNTNISAGSASIFVKNYTSISITGTGQITFTNPHTNGTVVILKSQGDVTITSSTASCVKLLSMGAAGGATETTGSNPNFIFDTSTHGGGAGVNGSSGGTVGSAGAIVTADFRYIDSAAKLSFLRSIVITPGGGGGGGGRSSSAGGLPGQGGRGGGALIIECGGNFNYTTTSGIAVNGQQPTAAVAGGGGIAGGGGGGGGNVHSAGTAGSNGGGAPGNGGGGGGAGGTILILYNTLTANTGTMNVSGGSGGSGEGSGGNGGAGADGYSIVMKNIF